MDIDSVSAIGFYIICIFVPIGVLGNIISLVVWTKGRKCSTASCSVYFRLLAVCDISCLIIPGVDYLLYYNPVNKIDLLAINGFFCKCISFMLGFCFQMSAYVTVALTVDRTIILLFPLKRYDLHANKRAYIVCLCIALVTFAVNLPRVWVFEISHSGYNDVQTCVYILNEATKLYLRWHFVGYQFAIPIAAVTSCNIIILLKVTCKKEPRNDHSVQRAQVRNIAILTVSVSIVHCISTIPRLLYTLITLGTDEIKETYDTLYKFHVISNALLYLNHAVNCFVYCFVGSQFRQDLKEMLCRCRH